MKKLDIAQRKALKAKAHNLKPVVMVGAKGLSDSVHEEIDRALIDHELIKVRVSGADREQRREAAALICQRHQACLVNIIGHIMILYRQSDKKKG